jgi:hypothetical protein
MHRAWYDASMRTTLTIDDQIAEALEDCARRFDRLFEEVVNETLRAGLAAKVKRKPKSYVVRPAALGGPRPGVRLDKALPLSDGIEDDELTGRMPRRK